jgi:hypothetical protein
MANIETQFSRVFIHYYSNKSASTCNLFISEPSKTQEQTMGRLFGILEFNTPSRENGPIINQLINQLEEVYYSKMDNTLDVEAAFEQSLDEVNQKFNKILEEKRFYLIGNLNEQTIKEKINLAIGLIKDNSIYLSYLNNIGIYLVHKTKQDYKIIDIRKISQEEPSATNGKNQAPKLFVNIIKGEVNPPDCLFIANSSFLNYISLERIKKITTSLPIHKAAEYFKNSLLQFEGQNFASLLIKNTNLQPEKADTSLPLKSISELNDIESSTVKLLTPSFWTNLKTSLKNLLLSLKANKIIKPKEAEKKEETGESDIQTVSIQTSSQPVNPSLFSSLINYQKKLFNKTKRGIKNIKFKLPSLSQRLHKISKYLKLKLAYLFNYLKRIPSLSKILLVIAVGLIILFVYSTSFLKHRQKQEILSEDFKNQVTAVSDKINSAESDLIYGDETNARQEITDAQNLLSNLAVESSRQKQEQEQLTARIEIVISKLRHITVINEPTLLANFSAQDTNLDIKNIIYQNNNLLAFDSHNNYIYQFNLDNREIKKIPNNLSDIGKFIKAKLINDRIIIYHDKNGLVEFKDDKLIPINITLPAGSQLADFDTYNGRLYTVDIKLNQIYRHPADNQNFSGGVAWLKEPFNMENINSIGIDTNIWLLDNTGPIYKFTKGVKQIFNPKNLDPVLTSPSRLFTNDETKYIYVLEPKSQRIIVLAKDGALNTQYYSPAFDNLKDMIIVEKEKKIFLLNDNKILFFNLTNIE